ncbi:MAG: sialate O-acetylesterase [Paludibacter sp.]|jgi:hypothetical protein|nr:sialate O-acetylesterase [Paludibacter sp.]
MKNNLTLLVLAIIFSSLIPVFAFTFPAKVTSIISNKEFKLYPTDDTYTYYDNTIRGMEPLLKTYHSTAGAQFRHITFLKFNTASLSTFVESAKLRLYTNGFISGGDNAHIFDLYPVRKSSWSEDDLTYTNSSEKAGADITSPLLASFTVQAGQAFPPQYIEFTGAELTKYLSDSLAAGKESISFRLRERNVVKNGGNAVIVQFHSRENTSGLFPELVVVEKNVDALRAADIKVDGVTLEGFSASVYRYLIMLPWSASVVPVVTATALLPDATVTITQAKTLSGTENERTAKVTIKVGSDVLNYSVIFEKSPPPNDARLSNILLEGQSLEFFNTGTNDYTVFLPFTATTVPEVTVQPYEPSAVTEIENARSIDPDDDESTRTTVLNVTSGDGSAFKTYRIVFQRLPELDIVLALGQSNMAGRADYSSYTGPMKEVYLLTPRGGMEVSSNPMNKYSNIRKDIGLQKLGPSYTCALKLTESLERPVAFVVNAQGGSALSSWYQPGTSNYDSSLVRAKAAQKYGKIRAVIWHQGESDSGNPGNYMSRLKTMVTNLRTDLKEPYLYFVAGELAYWLGNATAFNTMLRTITTAIPNSDWISAEGCTPLINVSDPHFDSHSAVLLGERYAAKLLDAVFVTSIAQPEDKKIEMRIDVNSEGVRIHAQDASLCFQIFDLPGRTHYSGNINNTNTDILPLNRGVYLISFSSANQHLLTQKVMIP